MWERIFEILNSQFEKKPSLVLIIRVNKFISGVPAFYKVFENEGFELV